MVVSLIANKIKLFLLSIVGVFRRALCCFRRRRRNSCDAVPLTHVGVDSQNYNDAESENWHWDEQQQLNEFTEPKTIQDHIELYRKRKFDAQQLEQNENEEEQANFFDDMAPKITRQTKLYINNDRNDSNTNNRLNLLTDEPIGTGELREWEENTGWEGETLDWDAQEALREKKREERERRLWEQQQKRMEKSGNKALGARLTDNIFNKKH